MMTKHSLPSIRIWAILSAALLLVGIPTLAQASLDVTSVTPATFELGATTTITITGTGFIEGTTVELSGIGTVADTFINDTTLTVNLPGSITAGTYDVTVSDPTPETATLTDAFTIMAPTPTLAPTLAPLTVSGSEPNQITNGQPNTLSVLGSGFTSDTVARIVGFGVLETTVLHNGALSAAIPGTIRAGEYAIEVSDAAGRKATSPDKLLVVAPPLPTAEPPTFPTPIEITTQPALSIVNFSASPNSIAPGQSTRLSFVVQNRGNQIARAIAVSLASESQFVVADGQASITVPDLLPGATFNASMTVSATQDVTGGPASIPLQLDYADNTGKTYSSTGELSVTILAAAYQSQVVIDAYDVDPSPAIPGEPLTVRMTISNRGTAMAAQVTLSVAAEDALLLPNGRGDTFVVGDMAPGEQMAVQMPLVVSSSAEAGSQVQSLVIRYYQDGEAKEANTGVTVEIAPVEQASPLLLLTTYETDLDVLKPGMRFTLDINLQNVGTTVAQDAIVTFGTIQSSGGSGGGSGEASPGDSQTSTSPSTTFAPLSTAGLHYIGDIAADGHVDISQDFIVAGNVTSGIYSLPVTLQYGLPDGTNKQDSINLSMVVIAPPRLRINPPDPLPEAVNAGEPVSLSLNIANMGQSGVDLEKATIRTNNGEIIEGETIQLETLDADDDTSLNVTIIPMDEGPLEIEVAIDYLNGLGQTETIELAYSTEVMAPPPPPDEPDMPMEPTPEPEPEIDWFGRIVMALLGLGS